MNPNISIQPSESLSVVVKYFDDLTEAQIEKLQQLEELYRFWNSQINVISRQDIDNLYLHHVLHSLSIAKFISFMPDTDIIDVGTGGGFPGIPLAIFFPEVNFHLVDSAKRKIKVVTSIAEALDLKNVVTDHARNYQVKKKFDFVLARAVSRFTKFVDISKINLHNQQRNELDNGIIYLKGGDLNEELKEFENQVEVKNINQYFDEAFFEEKKIVYWPFKA